MADFRVAYSHLMKAIWADPSMEQKISANPSLLQHFGFSRVPAHVHFAPTKGPDTIQGFNQLKSEFDNPANQSVTFYIPPKPSLYQAPSPGAQAGPVMLDSACCCCSCPCCCCT